MHPRAIATLSALLAALVWAPAAPAAEAPAAAQRLSVVARVPFADGTDLELFSRELREYRLEDGTPVTVDLEDPPVTRHFAMVGAETSGARIIDVTDPERPYPASQVLGCSVSQGDIQITPDAMTAVVAFQGLGACRSHAGKMLGDGGILVDISDVYAPKVLASAESDGGAHNTTIHPGGRYLYISTSNQIDHETQVPIYDISDPSQPRLVQSWSAPGNAPHDISFSADGRRAYMAGISQSRIVDTTDPEDPVLLSMVIPPGGTIGHDAVVSPDGAFLFLGDEAAGGNAYPCPGGAIYVYDIRDEADPQLLGVAWAGAGPVTTRPRDDPPTAEPDWENAGCTAHVLSMNPDGRSLTAAWYSAGARIFSFAGLYSGGQPSPGPVATWGAEGDRVVETAFVQPESTRTWAAKQYAPLPGYVFGSDNHDGFYVAKLDGSTG